MYIKQQSKFDKGEKKFLLTFCYYFRLYTLPKLHLLFFPRIIFPSHVIYFIFLY